MGPIYGNYRIPIERVINGRPAALSCKRIKSIFKNRKSSYLNFEISELCWNNKVEKCEQMCQNNTFYINMIFIHS